MKRPYDAVRAGAASAAADAAAADDSAPPDEIYTRLRSRGSPSLRRWVFVGIGQGRTIKLLVRMYDELSFLKAMIECKEGIPAGQQRIFFDGKELKLGKFMMENEIPDKSHLSMVTTMLGDDEAFP